MACITASKNLSESIRGGSDEIFDFLCQPCSAEKDVEAVRYCQQCCEYLCITCSDYHGKLSATKHHNVLDKSTMPKVNTSPKVQSSDVLTRTCPKHLDKVLEFFCKTHNQVCCAVCLTLNHSSCSDKNYIPDVAGSCANNQEYKTLVEDIDLLVQAIRKRQNNIEDDSKCNDNCHNKAIADIKEFRKHVNELLDNIEQETTRKVYKLHKDNSDAFREASAICQALLSEMKSMTRDMEEMTKSGKNNQLFLQVKLYCQRVTEAQREIKENNKCDVKRYTFCQDEKIQQMVSTLSAIWSLSVRQDDTPTSARYVRDINIKSEDNENECGINGITILTDYRMVVTDHKNKDVKLIDTKMNTIVSKLSCLSGPYDITKTKENQVAVAFSNEKKIEIFTVTDVLSTSHTIDTPGVVIVGICYDGSNFITACQHPGSVKIIDMFGRTLNTFVTDSKGMKLFTDPRHVALGRDKKVVYVTDREANAVTSLTTGGTVISVYENDMLKCPDGVGVDKYGSVFVCSRRSDTVHQLSPTGEFKQIILSKDRGLAFYPYAMAYGEEDDRLYISSSHAKPEDKNYIKLFQLE